MREQEWVLVPDVGRAFLVRDPANSSAVSQGLFFSVRGDKLKATESVWNAKGSLVTKIATLPADIGSLVFARIMGLYRDGGRRMSPQILAMAREL